MYRLIDGDFGDLLVTYAAGVKSGAFDEDLNRLDRADVARTLAGLGAMLKGWGLAMKRDDLNRIAHILLSDAQGTVVTRVFDILANI